MCVSRGAPGRVKKLGTIRTRRGFPYLCYFFRVYYLLIYRVLFTFRPAGALTRPFPVRTSGCCFRREEGLVRWPGRPVRVLGELVDHAARE